MSRSPQKTWKFDEWLKAWVFGTSEDGGGVFLSESLWCGNAVVDGKVYGVGNHDTKEEAMAEVEETYNSLRSQD